MEMHVVVIGAGLAGLAAAHYLVEAGIEVTVLEGRAGPGLGTSFANGALLHPSLVEPWNSPGIARVALSQLFDKRPALRFRAAAIPSMIGWGLKFLRQSAPGEFRTNTRKNLKLALYSLELMSDLRALPEMKFESYNRGSIQIFGTEAAAAGALAHVESLAPFGLTYRLLTVADALKLEPALGQIETPLAAAIHFPRDEGGDAHRFCSSIHEVLQRRGARLMYGVTCAAVLRDGDSISGIRDSSGRIFKADAYLLAAGSHSRALARTAGVRLPIVPVKGYSITVPRNARSTAPWMPVADMGLHVAVVPVGIDKVRVAGTAEFAGHDARVDPSRVDNLLSLLATLYPDYAATVSRDSVQPWVGFRPMTPDGVPMMGATAVRNLFLNTGHGHLGWTLAAGSGRTVADIIIGRRPVLDPQPYSLSRFD